MSTSIPSEYKNYKEYVRYLGHALRFFRERVKIPQERLAEAINVSVTYISLLENAHRVPTVHTLFRISCALHIQPAEIFKKAELLKKKYKRKNMRK